MRSLFSLLLLVSATLVGCDSTDAEETEPEVLASTEQGLVTCQAHQDTGYRNGNPFTITLIVADGYPVERSTANAYAVMQAAAASQGVGIRVNDGFRTPQEQAYYYSCYVNCSCNQCNNAAAPGYSKHQSGAALDLNTSEGNVFNWLTAYGANYGFYRTVPSERWHWEYMGGGPGGGPCPECNCSGSTVQTQACGTCGSQTRSCNGCSFSNWTACAGPDPEGGNQRCESAGKLGVCGDIRNRCLGGNLTCAQLVPQTDEVCDGLDNDCNGEVDDGHPALGATRPAFAATLLDFSAPATFQRGERVTAWAEFRNDGTTTWTRDNLWLTARGDSARLASDAWLSWNVAAALKGPVPPGASGRFVFELLADDVGSLSATFQLQQSSGAWVGCPHAELTASLHVLDSAPDAGTPLAVNGQAMGCSSAPVLPLVLLVMALLRRRRGVVAALAFTGCMGEASLSNGTEDPAVTVQSVSPLAISARGGAVLELKGRDFTSSTRVELDGAPTLTKLVSPTALSVTTPPLWAGVAQLVAIAGSGDKSALKGGVAVTPMELRFVQAFPDALSPNPGADVRSAAPRDFDGDGDVDLLTCTAAGRCTLLVNDGLGFFSGPPSTRDAGADAGSADAGADAGVPSGALPRGALLAAEDLDGDGDIDVLLQTASGPQAFANRGHFDLADAVPVFGVASVDAGPVDAGSVDAGGARLAPRPITALAVVDFDGDGQRDLVSANATPELGPFRIDLSTGRPDALAFTRAAQSPNQPVSYVVTALAVADLDGDRLLDVTLATRGADGFALRLFLQRGERFVEVGGGLVGNPGLLTVLLPGDVDGDGSIDLLAIGAGQDKLLLNDGAGHFFDATALSLPLDGSRGTSAVLVDLDRDRDLDVLIGNDGAPARLYVNDGHGNFRDRTPALPVTGLDAVLALWVENLDRDGDQDVVALTATGVQLELSVEPTP